MSKITIHGGMRIAGANPGMENLEFEELSFDPENPGVGRIWLNTAEQKVKFVTHLDELNRSIIRTAATADDVEALNTLLLTHALSHAPNGSDAIPTDAAVGLSPSSINKEGVADSLARSDHEHQITGFQPTSVQLSNIALLTGAGIPKRNAGGSWSLGALIPGDIPNLDWSKITTGKPTTLAGYGITDATPTNVVQIHSGTTPIMSGTSTILIGGSAPTSTQGTLLFSKSVVPKDNLSRFVIQFSGSVDASVNNNNNNSRTATVLVTLFRSIDGGAYVHLGYAAASIALADNPNAISLAIEDKPATALPVTYMARIGISGTVSWYLGRTVSFVMGGVNPSGWSIAELRPN